MLVRNRVVVASVGAGGTTTQTAGSLTMTSRRAASTTKKQQPTKSAAAVVSKPSLPTPTNPQETTATTASTSTSPPAKTTTNKPFQPKSPVSLASLGNLFKMSRDHELLPRKCNVRHNPTLEPPFRYEEVVATDVHELTEKNKRKRFGDFSLPDIPAEKTVDYQTTTQEVKDMFRNMFNPSSNADEDKRLAELKEQANNAAATSASSKKKQKKMGRNSKGGGAEEEEGSTPSRMLVDLFAATPPSATGNGAKKAKQSNKLRAEDLQEGLDPSKADINAGVNTTLDEMRTRMAMRKLMGLHFHTYGRQREMETLEGRRDKTLKELSKGDSLYYRVHTRQDIEDHLRKKQAQSGESEDPLLPSVIESYHARVQRLRDARAAEGGDSNAASNSDHMMGLHEMTSLAERKRERRREEIKAEQTRSAAGASNYPTDTSSPFALGSDFKNSTSFEYSLDAVTPADIFNRSNLFPQTENHIVVKTPLMRMLEERQKRKRQNAFMQQMKGTQKNPHQTIAHSGVSIGMDPRDQPRLDAPASSLLSPLLSDDDAERVHKGGNSGAALLLPSSAASPSPTKAKDSFRISSASITADFDPVAALRSINETSGGKSYKGVQDVIVQKGVGSGAVNEKFFSKEDFVNRGEIGLISKGAKPREMSQQYQESTKGARTKAAAQKAAELAAAAASSTTTTTTTTPTISADGDIDEDDDAGSLEDEWDDADMEAGFTPDMDLLGKKKNVGGGGGGVVAAAAVAGGGKARPGVVEEEEEAVVAEEEEDVEDVIATLKRLRKEDEEEEVSAIAATTTKQEDTKAKKSSSSSFNKNKKQQASTTVASRKAIDRLAASSTMTTVKKKSLNKKK